MHQASLAYRYDSIWDVLVAYRTVLVVYGTVLVAYGTVLLVYRTSWWHTGQSGLLGVCSFTSVENRKQKCPLISDLSPKSRFDLVDVWRTSVIHLGEKWTVQKHLLDRACVSDMVVRQALLTTGYHISVISNKWMLQLLRKSVQLLSFNFDLHMLH